MFDLDRNRLHQAFPRFLGPFAVSHLYSLLHALGFFGCEFRDTHKVGFIRQNALGL